MDFTINFNKAAFGHKIKKEDIIMAFDNVEYDAVLEEDDPDAEDKHLLIGFDRKANLIEVLYNVIDVDRIRVFHAMRCRSQFIPLLRDRRKK
ncbi:MAG: hypothetical protein LBI28_05330 [Treponema sp.]|jgi:uncharacterized DUF497 family protein|nr:hypothetical protein [Treponema sp.]